MTAHVITGRRVETGRVNAAVAARCSCGWRGPARHGSMGPARARRDGAEHLEAAR